MEINENAEAATTALGVVLKVFAQAHGVQPKDIEAFVGNMLDHAVEELVQLTM